MRTALVAAFAFFLGIAWGMGIASLLDSGIKHIQRKAEQIKYEDDYYERN